MKCQENQGYIRKALYHVIVRGNNGEKVFINRKRKTSIHKHNKRIQGKISVLNLCILHNG